MSGKVFRRWCSPKTILVVMRCSDDPAQVLSAIRHAEKPGSKLLLVQLSAGIRLSAASSMEGDRSLPWVPGPADLGSDYVRDSLSTEVLKRTFLLKDISVQQIPSVVRTFNIDRVMVTQSRGYERITQPGLEELLIATLEVPVWILGRGMPLNLASPLAVRRILVPVSHPPGLEFSLKFASQLAKSQQAVLSVLHVFGNSECRAAADERSPFTVQSWLTSSAVRVSSPHCPIEISIRQGDPGSEILEFNARKPHDLVVLRCSPNRLNGSYSRSRIVSRLCSELPCPVLVLGSSIHQPGTEAPVGVPVTRRHLARNPQELLGMES